MNNVDLFNQKNIDKILRDFQDPILYGEGYPYVRKSCREVCIYVIIPAHT
jgi:hypothetical protein